MRVASAELRRVARAPVICVPVPGDKSVSHRAVLLAAMCDGESRIEGLLDSEDVRRTIVAVEALGAEVVRRGDIVLVRGRPTWRDADRIDCGNSGTTARLLLGALAGRAGATLVGDPSLSMRPMRRALDPLREMGSRFDGDDRLPIRVVRSELRGRRILGRVASAQVKSAVLLAGLGAVGATTFVESAPTRDHTERMLPSFGVPVRVRGIGGAAEIGVGPCAPTATSIRVPGDPSSAFFLALAAAIRPGFVVRIESVGVNPLRIGAFAALRRMGVGVTFDRVVAFGNEPVADVVVVGQRRLVGVEVDPGDVPSMIDELPALAVAAAFAEGDTVVRGASELRLKESDRIAAVVAAVRAIGGRAEELPDGFVVHGGGAAGGAVESRGDHRIAMAFVVAGLRVPIRVDDDSSIQTSFPTFRDVLARLGG